MHEQEPYSIASLITWSWVIFLSVLGGCVNYYHRVDTHKIRHTMFRFIGELLTSAFVGIITFELCDYAQFSWQLTASFVAISGHMGTRLIFKLETIFVDALKAFFK